MGKKDRKSYVKNYTSEAHYKNKHQIGFYCLRESNIRFLTWLLGLYVTDNTLSLLLWATDSDPEPAGEQRKTATTLKVTLIRRFTGM